MREPAPATPPAATGPASAGSPPHVPQAPPPHQIKRTRLSGLWLALALSAVVLLLLLIFILENGHSVAISYFGAHGHLPLGAALLLAAVLGALLVIIPATGRILQLRLTARRHRRQDTTPASHPGTPTAAPDNTTSDDPRPG